MPLQKLSKAPESNKVALQAFLRPVAGTRLLDTRQGPRSDIAYNYFSFVVSLLIASGPFCPSELHAHVDALHVAMTRRERLGTTENEISTEDACVALELDQ